MSLLSTLLCILLVTAYSMGDSETRVKRQWGGPWGGGYGGGWGGPGYGGGWGGPGFGGWGWHPPYWHRPPPMFHRTVIVHHYHPWRS
uniref:Uncharacterized protein n=1 Tax=Heterorhabditis bacteriophora TaxID=37862 RepID=A0A1I7WQ97_HETBA